MFENIKQTDPDIHRLILEEIDRQNNGLELIASENIVSMAVLEALGSPLTNKYSEGYPAKRYYAGNQVIDQIEQLAIDRAKKLFSAEHANVQPLSGAPANIAAYFALLEPGDTVLGMELSHGGHLTHGSPVTYISKIFKFERYGIEKDGSIDYDKLRTVAKKIKPKLILAGYSAYPRDLDYQKFKKIADEVGAYTMADIAHLAGLIAAGLLNNPCPIFDVVTTTTHKTLRGPRGGMILCKEKFAKQIDKSVFPGFQGGPHEHQIAGKAVAFKEAMQPEFKTYCEQVLKNAKALAQELLNQGFDLVTGGTDNHLMLVDLTNMNVSGKQADVALDEVGITLNKNMVPDDPRSPMDPSGIRLGTPAMTTRGMKEDEMRIVGQAIGKIIKNIDNQEIKDEIKNIVTELTSKHPIYERIS
ncbi:MAG TPA: serine hydroxymethyltransferase [Candidatus Bipolaricaulota bacterium]|nr:serine hydroxymethyltransferase [Candidatus Bipolaricaulota bacterium]